MTAGQVLRGIEFSRPGGVPLLLDLYLPAEGTSQGPVPAVVHFHGGGWRMGERSPNPQLTSLLINNAGALG